MGRKVRLPLEILPLIDEGFHLFITAGINGTAVRLLLDTGASRSVLSKQLLLEKFPDIVVEESECMATGAGTNALQAGMASIPLFSLGDLTLSNLTMAVLDMQHVNQAYHQAGLPPIDGVLGCDLLYGLRAAINLKRGTLRFKRPKKADKKHRTP